MDSPRDSRHDSTHEVVQRRVKLTQDEGRNAGEAGPRSRTDEHLNAGPCSSDTTKCPTPRMEPAGVGFVVDSDDGSAAFAEDDAEDDADTAG